MHSLTFVFIVNQTRLWLTINLHRRICTIITSQPGGVRSYDAISMFVCLWVCLSVRSRRPISKTTRPDFTKFSVHVTCGCGSVLFWRQCHMSCTSAFVDDVRHIFTWLAKYWYRLGICDVASYSPWLARCRHLLLTWGRSLANCLVIQVGQQQPGFANCSLASVERRLPFYGPVGCMTSRLTNRTLLPICLKSQFLFQFFVSHKILSKIKERSKRVCVYCFRDVGITWQSSVLPKYRHGTFWRSCWFVIYGKIF